jgi:hypothetical protein
VKAAVLIQAHREPAIINRLIRSLLHPGISVYVSVDKKSRIDPAVLDPGARYLGAKRDIWWGDFSLVEGTLDGLAEIRRVDKDYSHAILLSGQDYPVWSGDRILGFLEENEGRSFLHHAPLAPGGWPEAAARLEHHHYHGPSAARRLASKAARGVRRLLGLKRTLPGGLAPHGGSNWFMLAREAVDHCLDYAAANPAYVEFMRTVAIPDESFVHTILLNSPLRGSVVNDNMRYVDWSERRPNPKLLTAADHPAIAASGKMFCRKVDSRVSMELLDLLDAGRAA